jgi:hypothetical protein
MPYEHVLTGPLSIRGMRAHFDAVVTHSMPGTARLQLFDRWCNHLQRRAFAHDISWLPATGTATATANFPTRRIQEILLRLIEETPVVTGEQPAAF